MDSFSNRRRSIVGLIVWGLAGVPIPGSASRPDSLAIQRIIALPRSFGTRPVHLAIDSARHRIFLTTSSSAEVDVIDEDSGAVRARIPTPRGAVPVYRSTDDRLMVLSAGRAATYDGASYKAIGITRLDAPVVAATYDPSLTRLYIISLRKRQTRLVGLDLASNRQRSTLGIRAGSAALALDAYRPRVYLADSAERRIIVIDRWRNEVVRSWPLESSGCDVVALDEDGQRLYVAAKDGDAQVLDTNTGRQVAKLQLGNGANGLLFDSGSKMLVETANGVLRLYARSGPPSASAIHAARARVYVHAPFAEWLVRSMLSEHPDLRKMGLHAVAPGTRVTAIIANGNATRIGIPTTSGDFAAVASGSTYGPLIDGNYYNMKMPMFDAAGKRFGLLVMEIPSSSAVDATDAVRIAESIRQELASRIHSAATLFGPQPRGSR